MIRVRATSGANESLKRARRLLKYPRLCRRTGTTLAEGLHLAGELCKHPELIRTNFLSVRERTEITSFELFWESLSI